MSPLLLKAIRQSDTEVIEFFVERSGQVPKCLNLCASLIDEIDLIFTASANRLPCCCE